MKCNAALMIAVASFLSFVFKTNVNYSSIFVIDGYVNRWYNRIGSCNSWHSWHTACCCWRRWIIYLSAGLFKKEAELRAGGWMVGFECYIWVRLRGRLCSVDLCARACGGVVWSVAWLAVDLFAHMSSPFEKRMFAMSERCRSTAPSAADDASFARGRRIKPARAATAVNGFRIHWLEAELH